MKIYLFSVLGVSVAILITIYILHSIGLSTMLRRTGFRKPWFAWLPFCSDFALGCLADQHKDIFPPKKRGKKLMLLSIAYVVSNLAYQLAYWYVAAKPMWAFLKYFCSFELNNLDMNAVFAAYENYDATVAAAITPAISALSIISAVASLCYVFYRIFVLVRVYRIFTPQKALLCTLLSAFIDQSSGIIFFVIRKKPLHNLRWQTEDEIEIPKL